MDFKNPLRLPLADLLQPFMWGAALLGLLWALAGTNTNAEPAHRRSAGARASEQESMGRRMLEIGRRLSLPAEPWEVVRARGIEEAHRQSLAVVERGLKLDAESAALASAMRAHLTREAPAASERLARIIGVDGLASRIVRGVDARTGWLPLGRAKAPAFLASVAFHESSWRWRVRDLRGSRGEGCAFQIAPSTAYLVGARPEVIAKDFGACLDAAVEVMRLCAERGGDVPSEDWMGCYATAGRCGGAPDVVEQRFATARLLLGAAP